MPDWLRILLLILTCISFVPQIYRLARGRGDAAGINSGYVLINLIAATELFCMSFLLIMPYSRADADTNDPRIASAWIDFANVSIIWILWLVIFIVCATYRWHEARSNESHKVSFYIFWLMISVVPILGDAIGYADAPTEPIPIRIINYRIYFTVHVCYIIPVITLLALVAFTLQAREIMARPPESGTGALSVATVALQMVVFSVLAATWYPSRLRHNGSDTSFLEWYEFAGFLTVNHAFFALEQALLLVAMGWHRWGSRRGTDDPPDETQPLIGSL